MTELHCRPTAEMDPITLYRLLALRSEVFVLEQNCVYLDLDGRDIEPATLQLWAAQGGGVLATLRLLRDARCWRIGRVATAKNARSSGLAGQLMTAALGEGVRREQLPFVLDAQSYLRGWYERFGFEVVGDEFVEDGIAHLPMRRD